MKMLTAGMAVLLLAGCAVAPYQGGFIYTQIQAPLDVRDNASACSKKGTSSASNVLGLFGFGDAGIEAAKKAGGITAVSSVDVRFTQFLGLFSNSTTVVCGE